MSTPSTPPSPQNSTSTPTPQESTPKSPKSILSAPANTPVWHYKWFHWLLGVLLLLATCSYILPTATHLFGLAQPVLLPVICGLILAYITNPWVTRLEARGIKRPLSSGSIVGVLALLVLGTLLIAVPMIGIQATKLIKLLPEYLTALSQRVETHHPDAALWLSDMANKARQGSGAEQFGSHALKALGFGLSAVLGVISFTLYVAVAGIVCTLSYFFFSWHFRTIIQYPKPFIPVEYRERVLILSKKMDVALSGYIRGRLIQSIILGMICGVGWAICGVDYWFLLGFAAMVLGLLPFLPVLTLPLAIALACLEGLAPNGVPFNIWWMVVGPTAVYGIAQLIDGWVVEPLVQGKATGLDPLTVLLAVMLGGALGGIVGVLIAIPVAACFKILLQEELLPRLRNLANNAEQADLPPSSE